MSSDQLDFVTYCIGNLSMRLQLPQRTIYLKLKDSGILENYIIQAKNARIIAILAEKFDGSLDKAMDVFYKSATAQMIQDGVADLHCRSDHYLADEIYTGGRQLRCVKAVR